MYTLTLACSYKDFFLLQAQQRPRTQKTKSEIVSGTVF